MSLEEVRANKVLERIIRGYLERGEFITSSEIVEAYDLYVAEHPLDENNYDSSNFLLDYKEESSALKYNSSFKNIHEDLDDTYDTLKFLASQRSTNLERWKTELGKFSRKVEELKNSLESLLLLQRDTAGYFDLITDQFFNLDKIDLVETTANVDIDKNVVSITEDKNSSSKVNLNQIAEGDITFNVITKTGLLAYNQGPDSLLTNVLKDESKVWQHRVFMSTYSKPVDVELKIKIANDPIELNRIAIELHASNTSSNVELLVQTSIDDYNWSNVLYNNNPQVVSEKAYFDFATIEAKFVKIIMTKEGYDSIENSRYMYEFGAKNISFYTRSYSDVDSLFVSAPLYILEDPDDLLSKKEFNNISCEVCEILPDGTNIDYYISSDSGSTWLSITPSNRSDARYPKVVPVGTQSIDSSSQSIALDFVTSLAYKNESDRLLDYIIVKGLNEIPNHRIKVWRNIGRADDSILVRGTITGWQFDGNYYTTYVNIENANGVYMELGDSIAELDHSQVTGTVFMSSGEHKFKTHKSNWIKMPTAANPLDEDEFKNKDPLYPYNHKLLIEGFTYDPSFDGDEIYIGVDLHAAYILQLVSAFDFDYNLPNDYYDKFKIWVDPASGDNQLIVKYDENVSDFNEEYFYINSRLVSNNKDELLFKAEFTTEDIGVSPILTGYKIKLGN